jgi:hypothetical protein
MNLLDLLLHLGSFILPALFMALALPFAAKLGRGRAIRTPRYRVQFALQLVCGLAVLIVGLVLTGDDGRMVTYGALIVVAGSLQALMRRGKGNG